MENLEKYFKLYDEKKYKSYFYTYTYNDIINHFIEYKIYYIDKYWHLLDRDKINEGFEKIIFNITDIEQKKKLLPLILFLGQEFYLKLLKTNFFDDIKEFIFDEFEQLNLKIDLEKYNKYSWEYESLSLMSEKLKIKDYEAIYNFNINSNIFNYQYANFIYNFALKYNFEKYCDVLGKKDVFTFLNLTINLNINELKNIRVKLKANRFVANLILLRKVSDITVISDIIKDFSNDKNWFKFVEFVEFVFKINNNDIYKILANIVSILSLEKVKLVSRYILFEHNIDNFFFNILNEDYQKLIAFQLYKKWKKYIKTNKSIIDITLTPLINIIIFYIQNSLNSNKRKRVINKILQRLNDIDNIWFFNYNEYLECLYYLLTILFVYSYQLGYKEDEIKRVLDKYPQLKKQNCIEKLSVIEIFNQSFKQGNLP